MTYSFIQPQIFIEFRIMLSTRNIDDKFNPGHRRTTKEPRI